MTCMVLEVKRENKSTFDLFGLCFARRNIRFSVVSKLFFGQFRRVNYVNIASTVLPAKSDSDFMFVYKVIRDL